MKILIVDDSNAKIADIVGLIREVSHTFEVDTSTDCISTVSKLSVKFDLLILDLFLPLRPGDQPNREGGKFIVDQIKRDIKLKAPTYILCLSQFEDLIENFHPLWPTIKYDPTNTSWRQIIRELLQYIARQQESGEAVDIERIPTIYMEGKLDEKIMNAALLLYFPEHKGKIKIISEHSAGASWVTRKLIIWGHSLFRDAQDKYIRAAGIYDLDAAGTEAIAELNRTIKENSAESQCIKAFKYATNFAKHLIPIYKKGIRLPITLEEMLSPACWKHAHEKNWLAERNNMDMLLKDPANWDKMKKSLNEHIKDLAFTKEENMFLSKIHFNNKVDFCNHVLNLEESEKRTALSSFEPMLQEVISYLLPT